MSLDEVIKRLRISLAIVIGFVAGKLAAGLGGGHASEFFIGGFGLGVLATQGAFWIMDRIQGKLKPGEE